MAEVNGTTGGSSDPRNPVPLIIDGKEVIGPNHFSVINPTDGKEVWQAGGASLNNAIQAVESAQAAFKTWSKRKPAFRRDVFMRAAQLFEQRRRELMQVQKDETGAEEGFMDWILNVTIEDLKGTAAKCMGISGSIVESEHEVVGSGLFFVSRTVLSCLLRHGELRLSDGLARLLIPYHAGMRRGLSDAVELHTLWPPATLLF